MEKYGVEELEKLSMVCPRCGASLRDPDETGGILICAECGSAPFENNESKTKRESE